MRFRVRSEGDTERLASVFASAVRRGDSVGLCGDLGAGKTTFVRYLVVALGGCSRDVSSPSYTLQHEYETPDGGVVDHWDLYRISELPDELAEPPGRSVVRLIEWPDRCAELPRSLDLLIHFEVSESGERLVTIQGPRASAVNAVLQNRYGTKD